MTIRWILNDPVAVETWTVPINPDSMTSVEPPQKTVRFGRTLRPDTRTATMLGKPVPWDWEFGGVIRTKAHYDGLLDWVARTNAIELTDHLGRQFRVYLTDFVPVDRQPTPNTPWRLRYTVKAKILARLA